MVDVYVYACRKIADFQQQVRVFAAAAKLLASWTVKLLAVEAASSKAFAI
ncbi:hypothetical protein ACEYW6_00650 [Nostoc sp. UIC 10607]